MNSKLVLSDVGDETWGAVLEDGQVVELHVENRRRPGMAGNVYMGRVGRVLPGMQSAFIDIGIDKDVFLHGSDLPSARGDAFDFPMEEEEPEALDAADSGPLADAISGARAEAEATGAAGGIGAEGQEAPDEAALASAQAGAIDRARRPRHPAAPIQDLLREGQELVVQVVREPIAAKGARVTAQITLPGRALVYLPFMDKVFVSRKIVDASERERLMVLAQQWTSREQGGWIIRTAAEGAAQAWLDLDAAYLAGLWRSIQQRQRCAGAPVLLHRDLGLPERLLRDVISEGFDEVIVDSERLREAATTFLGRYAPGLHARVRLADAGRPVFDDLGIHREIERAQRTRVGLRSGGSIVVNQTEALVAIDVNTGSYVGRTGLEETVLRTNLEAAREIVRLLRLRDLSGIIVIDFIDMTDPSHRETLVQALSDELRRDRSHSRLLAMSDFGLVQLTRKRTRRSLDRALMRTCPTCHGGGRIRSEIVMYYEIQRELARGAALAGREGPLVRLHPAVLARLEEEGLRIRMPASGAVAESASPVRLVPDPSLSEERYEIAW